MKVGVKGNNKRSRTDLGIRRAARDLGCCYSHLSRVLRGERSSRRLLVRYAAWRKDS
jgi:hypothetical protein